MSSIGKKVVSGITGLALCGFIVSHLSGNFLLLVGADAFNEYTHFLGSIAHGAFLPVAEVGLIILFGTHAIAGIRVALDRRRARPVRNARRAHAGGPSRKTVASRLMMFTGVVLLIFLLVHVYTFRLGPAEADGYVTTLHGEEVRDLYRLVIETFQEPIPVIGYTLVMLLLGFHLRHGFWSAFQSLGANNPKYMPLIAAAGVLFAVVMALGFLMIPIYIYLFIEPPAVMAAAQGGAP